MVKIGPIRREVAFKMQPLNDYTLSTLAYFLKYVGDDIV
jgi:hypothetical protein